MTVVLNLMFFSYGLFTGENEVGAIYYFTRIIIRKANILISALLIFIPLVAIFPVKPPCNISTNGRCTTLVIIVVVFHGVCFQIFSLWKTRFLGYPWRNPSYIIVGLVITRTMWLGLEITLDTSLLATHVKNIFDLADDSPPEPLPFPLVWLLK